MRAMLGDEVVDARAGRQPRRPRRRVAGLARPARSRRPVWLNRQWVEADVRITTGFVEPHFFAGFSGGPKLVAPGLAGLETVLTLHDAPRIGDPRATWGVMRGQPGARRHPRGRRGRGRRRLRPRRGPRPRPAGRRGVRRRAARRCTPRPASVVAAAGDAAGARAVRRRGDDELGLPARPEPLPGGEGHVGGGDGRAKPGGTIVCAAECRDGFPDHGSYREVLGLRAVAGGAARDDRGAASAPSPTSGRCRCRPRCSPTRAWSCARRTSPTEDLATAHLGHTDDVAATVVEALDRAGPDARVCVLPEGPQTIPYVA